MRQILCFLFFSLCLEGPLFTLKKDSAFKWREMKKRFGNEWISVSFPFKPKVDKIETDVNVYFTRTAQAVYLMIVALNQDNLNFIDDFQSFIEEKNLNLRSFDSYKSGSSTVIDTEFYPKYGSIHYKERIIMSKYNTYFLITVFNKGAKEEHKMFAESFKKTRIIKN